MGGKHSSSRSTNSSFKSSPTLNKNEKCPWCGEEFPAKTTCTEFNLHGAQCAAMKMSEKNDVSNWVTDAEENENKILQSRVQEYVLKYKKKILPNKKKNDYTFEKKISKLKEEISKRKISWQDGFCQLDWTRGNFLYQTLFQIKNINLFKELKINFEGEISYDAGGIIREWFTILFQEWEGKKLYLFKQSDTTDFSYIINNWIDHENIKEEFFLLIGKLIGKALLDNITVNICFNKLIFKILVDEQISFDDLIFIDSPLYHSWKNLQDIKNTENLNINDLSLYYSVDLKNEENKTSTFDLIPNGRNISVNDLDDYIAKRIDFMVGSIYIFIKDIQTAWHEIIPKKIISLFTSDELELLINGKPYIDIEEWKQFTEYKEPYHQDHLVIKWFWEVVEDWDSRQLSNWLQFSTGTSRVPLGGFEELESNRGEKARFTIIEIPFVMNKKNYIKAHTCFNRIELPLFASKDWLEEAVIFISNIEIFGFGID